MDEIDREPETLQDALKLIQQLRMALSCTLKVIAVDNVARPDDDRQNGLKQELFESVVSLGKAYRIEIESCGDYWVFEGATCVDNPDGIAEFRKVPLPGNVVLIVCDRLSCTDNFEKYGLK